MTDLNYENKKKGAENLIKFVPDYISSASTGWRYYFEIA